MYVVVIIKMTDDITQYQYNIQVSTIILFSALSTAITVLASPKKSTQYDFQGLLKFIYRNIVILFSFSTLFVSSVFLVKLNASSGITTDSLPGWITPWWSAIIILTILTTLTVSHYVLLVIFDMSTIDLVPLGQSSDLVMINNVQNNRYKPKFYLTSIINSVIITCVCIITVLSAVILCDPGNC